MDDVFVTPLIRTWGTSDNFLYGNANSQARALELSADGSVFVGGMTANFAYGGSAEYDYLLIKLDHDLNFVWARSWGDIDLTD